MPPLSGNGIKTWQDYWQEAQNHGVTHSLVIGVDQASSEKAINIAQTDSHLKATVGIHPHAIIENNLVSVNFSQEVLPKWIHGLEKLLATNTINKLVIAIGETGLDYFRLDLSTDSGQLERSLQLDLCIAQIDLANKYDLPLSFHVRDNGDAAYSDILSLVKVHKKTDKPFILHCVSGSVKYAQKALELGAYISVAGNVTYKSAEVIRDIVKATPKDRLLLETDAPFLPPIPHRGKTCEPWMIQLTADYLQNTCQYSLEQIYSNTCQVFPEFLS